MAQLVVRDLADDVKERLKRRAKLHGRSLESEVCAVLEAAANTNDTQPAAQGFGTDLLAEMAKHPLDLETGLEFEQLLENERSARRVRGSRPIDFE